MVGGDLWVRAAEDFVLAEPLLVEGPQQAQRVHEVTRVEDVVDYALEVISVDGKRTEISLKSLAMTLQELTRVTYKVCEKITLISFKSNFYMKYIHCNVFHP